MEFQEKSLLLSSEVDEMRELNSRKEGVYGREYKCHEERREFF